MRLFPCLAAIAAVAAGQYCDSHSGTFMVPRNERCTPCADFAGCEISHFSTPGVLGKTCHCVYTSASKPPPPSPSPPTSRERGGKFTTLFELYGENATHDGTCKHVSCAWTRSWSCPGQPSGTHGHAHDDGSEAFLCCCHLHPPYPPSPPPPPHSCLRETAPPEGEPVLFSVIAGSYFCLLCLWVLVFMVWTQGLTSKLAAVVLWVGSIWMIVLPIEMIMEVLYPSACMACDTELVNLAIVTGSVIALLAGIHVVSTEDFAKPLRMFLFGFPFVFTVLNGLLRVAGGVGSTSALFLVAFFLTLALLALGSSIMMARKFFFERPILPAEEVLFFKESSLEKINSRFRKYALPMPNIPNFIEMLVAFTTILSFSAIPLAPSIRWEAFLSIRDLGFLPEWLEHLDLIGVCKELLRYYLIDLISYRADLDFWKLGFGIGVLVSLVYPKYVIRPVWQHRQIAQQIHNLNHQLLLLPASGLTWRAIGKRKPGRGFELSNAAPLQEALKIKTDFTTDGWKADFTTDEWQEFGIQDLCIGHFVLSGDTYFQPHESEPEETNEEQSEREETSMRTGELEEVEARTAVAEVEAEAGERSQQKKIRELNKQIKDQEEEQEKAREGDQMWLMRGSQYLTTTFYFSVMRLFFRGFSCSSTDQPCALTLDVWPELVCYQDPTHIFLVALPAGFAILQFYPFAVVARGFFQLMDPDLHIRHQQWYLFTLINLQTLLAASDIFLKDNDWAKLWLCASANGVMLALHLFVWKEDACTFAPLRDIKVAGFGISSTLTVGAMIVLWADPREWVLVQIIVEVVVYLLVLFMIFRIVKSALLPMLDEVTKQLRKWNGWNELPEENQQRKHSFGEAGSSSAHAQKKER